MQLCHLSVKAFLRSLKHILKTVYSAHHTIVTNLFNFCDVTVHLRLEFYYVHIAVPLLLGDHLDKTLKEIAHLLKRIGLRNAVVLQNHI